MEHMFEILLHGSIIASILAMIYFCVIFALPLAVTIFFVGVVINMLKPEEVIMEMENPEQFFHKARDDG